LAGSPGADAGGARHGSPGDRPRSSAKDRALGLLAVRWRSREELRRRLLRAGYEPEDVAGTLEDLERAGLIEDDRFAREVVREHAGRRLSGDRAIRQVLREKGVADEVVERALEGAGDELNRARELAEKRAARLRGLAGEGASRRLFGLLVRRGYGPNVARDAVRAALAEPEASAFSPEEG
jgi:regulatory protein